LRLSSFFDVDTRMNVFERKAWSIEAEHALQTTTENTARLQKRVESGDAELWRVRSVECDGWLVTQMHPDLLFVWCYHGRGFVPLARALARMALDNGLSRLGWFTYHRGAARIFRHVRPIVVNTMIPGEMRFTLNCEALWQLPKTLVEVSRCGQSAGTTSTSDHSIHKAHERLTRQRTRARNSRPASRIPTVAVTL
jgi:hypothetical protein